MSVKPPMIEPAPYWGYKSPPTPAEGPPGFTGNWFSLSPGMRREIWRDYDLRSQTDAAVGESDERNAPALIGLFDAKKKRDKMRYADLVMQKFADAEHADKREFLEKKAAVERAAKERI